MELLSAFHMQVDSRSCLLHQNPHQRGPTWWITITLPALKVVVTVRNGCPQPLAPSISISTTSAVSSVVTLRNRSLLPQLTRGDFCHRVLVHVPCRREEHLLGARNPKALSEAAECSQVAGMSRFCWYLYRGSRYQPPCHQGSLSTMSRRPIPRCCSHS